jgi:bacteriorhodopsin
MACYGQQLLESACSTLTPVVLLVSPRPPTCLWPLVSKSDNYPSSLLGAFALFELTYRLFLPLVYGMTGYGYTIVDGRVFHYARYLDWLVTTPLLLLDLGALAGISNEDALMLVILDILMILAGLAGGLTTGAASFWLWILGCTFFLPIIYDLAVTFRAKAKELGEAASSCYEKLFILTLVLWTAYPVVFFFAEYANTLPTTYEIGTYMVLDVTAKCVFGFILLTSRDGLEQATTGYAPVNGISV